METDSGDAIGSGLGREVLESQIDGRVEKAVLYVDHQGAGQFLDDFRLSLPIDLAGTRLARIGRDAREAVSLAPVDLGGEQGFGD